MGEVEVTVAVPVKDRREQMERCLRACLQLDHPSFEVLVVDNGSTDGTKEMVLEVARTADVPVRLEEVPGSVGRVRNEAARRARGAVIAYTDSDCLPEPQWLREGLAPFRDPQVGIVCGPTLPEHPPEQGWSATQDIAGFSGRFETCNVLFRRSAFLEGEGFAEDGFGWEDTAGAYAVKRRGWEVRFAEGAVVRHDVTYPGFWWHVKRQRIHLQIAQMVRDYPEVRRELLYAGIFMNERHARFMGLVAAVVLARRFPPALLLAIPYARFLARFQLRPRTVAQGVVYDAATTVNVLRSAVRYRRFVL